MIHVQRQLNLGAGKTSGWAWSDPSFWLTAAKNACGVAPAQCCEGRSKIALLPALGHLLGTKSDP